MHIQSGFRRIHPLVAVASVAVILFSLLGIAAITGILPTSHGSIAPAHAATDEVPQPSAVATKANTAQAQQVASARNPRHDAQQVTASNTPVHTSPEHPPAKPAPQNSPVGIGVGAVVGGALGSQVGSGDGKTLATILGAIGGGYIGNEVAKKNQ